MATQFMSPAAYMAVPPITGYPGYPTGKSGGFSFRSRVERVDWRKISMVDIDNISRTLDFTTLQENIMNITFCNIEAELDIRSIDLNFVKLFKLAQLTIEYLLHSQEYLSTLCTSLEDKGKQSDQEVEKMKHQIEELQKELTEVKKESHKRKKMLIAQQQLLHAGNESFNKCPFCAKAFISSSYLQSHIIRRHSTSASNKDGSLSVSPDLGLGLESGRNILETENLLLKEKIYRYETEHNLRNEAMTLQNNNKDKKSMSTKVNQISSESLENVEKREKIGKSVALMNELRELNSKYQSSQKALKELEARTGGKRSYLGDLEDEIENEKELLKEQRTEVAAFKEQLQQQLDTMKNHMDTKLSKQEKKWQKRMQNVNHEHANEIKKLNNVLETTNKLQKDLSKNKQLKDHHAEEILQHTRERDKKLETQVQLIEKEIRRSVEFKTQKVDTKNKGNQGDMEKTAVTTVTRQSLMYPSDDEKSTALGTGTSSLRSFHSGTGRSTMGQTSTQSLQTLQFLEELRKNQSFAEMRKQLAELLQEHMEKKGIPPSQTGIADEVLKSKLDILSTHRQSHIQRYPDFNELRNYYNKKATEEAHKKLSNSSWDLRSRSAQQSPVTLSRPRSGPPHPQQHLSTHRTIPHSSSHEGSPNIRPQPHPRATNPQNSNLRLSTGSTTEWTSTQFESDADSSKGIVTVPGTRLIHSGPARGPGGLTPSPRSQGPKTRLIQSRPLSSTDVGLVDRNDRKLVSVPASPKRSGAFTDKKQSTESKSFGGVNNGSETVGHKQNEENSDLDNDWDDSEPAESAPAVIKHGTARASTDASNTYGSSAWGSSSKAASTIKDKERRSTSRSSFVSVTDVSSDEDEL